MDIDYYQTMLADMEQEDILTMDDEPMSVLGKLKSARYDRIDAKGFTHNTRRNAGRSHAYYKRQARRAERRAGAEIVRMAGRM